LASGASKRIRALYALVDNLVNIATQSLPKGTLDESDESESDSLSDSEHQSKRMKAVLRPAVTVLREARRLAQERNKHVC